MALREILAHFGVEVEGEKLEKFDHKVAEVTEKLKQFGEIIAASFIGERMHAFIEDQVKAGAALNDMSERLGISTDELQRFEYVAGLAGASAEEASNGIRFLNRNIGQALEGGEAAKSFTEMHIALKGLDGQVRPTMEVMGDLAEHIKGLDHAKATALAMKVLGRGGVALIPMLKGGREEIEKFSAEFETLGGGMSKDFVKAADEADDNIFRLKTSMKALKSTIAMALMPSFNNMNLRITKWVVNIIKLTRKTQVLGSALLALKLGTIAGIIFKIAKLMGMAEGGAFGFIKTLLKMGPIVILIGVLYLIFDDFYTMMTGGESIIGKVLDAFFGFGTSTEVVETLTKAWHDLVDWLGNGGTADLQKFARAITGSLIVACDALITAGMLIGNAFMFAWDAIGGKLTDADKDLSNMGKAVDSFGKRFEKIGNWVGSGDFGGPSAVAQAAAGPRPMLSADRNTNAHGGGGSPMSVGARQPLAIEINNHISGVSDPKEAAKHAGRMTKESISGAAANRAAFAAVGSGT